MPKEKRKSKPGSKGGSSYWTMYRKSKDVENQTVPNQLENKSTESLEVTIDLENSVQKDSYNYERNCNDEQNDFLRDETDEHYILDSSEEDFNDGLSDIEKKNKFDSQACDIFKNLILRNPQLSNIFINDLLGCLCSVGVNVPKDHRTLLGTNKNPIKLRKVPPGVYWHFGLEHLIRKFLENGIKLPKYIDIIANMDGLPLNKSSKANFWPISMSISNLKVVKPFIIGVYFDEKAKPDCSRDYLEDFVKDLVQLKQIGFQGIFVRKAIYPLDGPALAFVKKVQGHNAKEGCNRCTVVGEWKCNRTCFPDTSYNERRTDTEFRQRNYNKHHKTIEPGPLEQEELCTDMINDFPIDPLHCADLGVMKKLILCWTGNLRLGNTYKAPPTMKITLTSLQILTIDSHLKFIAKDQPSEYNRPSRELSMCKLWKGAEFSCILHCTGPVIFKNILPNMVYENFLLFHVASTIATCEEHKKLWPLCKNLFLEFVNSFKVLYGDYSVSYNVHNLLHIYDDLNYLGRPITYSSTASFESRLGLIKKLVRGGNRRIEQVAHRVEETIDFEIQNYKKELDEGNFLIINIFNLI